MRTDVEEGTDRSIIAAHDDDALAPQFEGDEIAGVGNVFLTRCPHPHARPEAGTLLFHPLLRILAILCNDPGSVFDIRGFGFIGILWRIRVDSAREAGRSRLGEA